MLKTFALSFLFAISFQLLLAIVKETGLDSHSSRNLPELILMLASIPWPIPIITYVLDGTEFIDPYLAQAIMLYAVSIGFGINLTLIHYAYKKLHSVIRDKSDKIVK